MRIEGMIQMNDFYTPAPAPSTYYGYMSGNTYMIDGYRMYLQGGYWYFVDFPTAPPRRASRQHYRTGGTAGTLLKVFGVLSFLAGICLMRRWYRLPPARGRTRLVRHLRHRD